MAILVSFLLVVGLIVLAVLFFIPLLVEQFAALVKAVPGIAGTDERHPNNALASLQDRGACPGARSKLSPGSEKISSAP